MTVMTDYRGEGLTLEEILWMPRGIRERYLRRYIESALEQRNWSEAEKGYRTLEELDVDPQSNDMGELLTVINVLRAKNLLSLGKRKEWPGLGKKTVEYIEQAQKLLEQIGLDISDEPYRSEVLRIAGLYTDDPDTVSKLYKIIESE